MLDHLFSNKGWHKIVFDYVSYLSIFFIIVTYTGIFYINPAYVHILNNVLLYYVCAVLLIRFNPYVKHSYLEFDRKIAFTAGIILFTTIVGQHLANNITYYMSSMTK
uniref:Uncharacterized protein n=1 Tax=viral metagenome TaxID=1070528 RepID=A0A6C0IJJ2_9ZZZZ